MMLFVRRDTTKKNREPAYRKSIIESLEKHFFAAAFFSQNVAFCQNHEEENRNTPPPPLAAIEMHKLPAVVPSALVDAAGCRRALADTAPRI